ncbi:DUF2637 domain-containing protein, partial [Streptomyces sp. NPDC001177]
VVAVEAARHAIGRIADITADKHMEGVRLTRWMLSPVPTFLLWRRMKLWELRSYEQVIKLEQERLVYQARLHARFGRAWRRKAPVESLMPLRLARYGVPLAETAPAGLAAADIEEPLLRPAPAIEQSQIPAQRKGLPAGATASHRESAQSEEAALQTAVNAPVTVPDGASSKQKVDVAGVGHVADAYGAWLSTFGSEPTVAQFGAWLRERHGISTAAGGPLTGEQLEPLLQVLKQRYSSASEVQDAVADGEASWEAYFRSAWHAYAQQHGSYPDAERLAQYVYEVDGITAADGQPISGADLAAYVAEIEARAHDGNRPETDASADASTMNEPDEQLVAGFHADVDAGRPAGTGVQAAAGERSPRVDAQVDDEDVPGDASQEAGLTVVDRYFLAWLDYQSQHGEEPGPAELSEFLAAKGMFGRGRRPVSPSTLRRYPLAFRTYSVWAEHRVGSEEMPSPGAVAQVCAARGITGQYNKPVSPDYILEQSEDFERRWIALRRYHAESR